MKRLLIAVLLLAGCAAGQKSGTLIVDGNKIVAGNLTTRRGTLVRAEKLTEAEQKKLAEAEAKLAAAQKEFDDTQAAIAAAHDMRQSHWMEYDEWYVFDGDWILQHHRTYWQSMIGW